MIPSGAPVDGVGDFHLSFVITGPTGAGKTYILRESRRIFTNTHGDRYRCLLFEPNGGASTWELLLDKHDNDPSQWEGIWRRLLLTAEVCILHAHRTLLTKRMQRRLAKIVDLLPPTLFANPSPKSPFTIANAFGQDRTTVGRFPSRSSWDEVEDLVSASQIRLPKYLIQLDRLDEYFDNAPQLMLEMQVGLMRCLIKRAARPSAITFQAAVRGTVREFWLGRTGHDVAGDSGFLQVSCGEGLLHELFAESMALESKRWAGDSRLCESDLFYVEARKATEDLANYVCRHTFLTPGDIKRMVRYLSAKRREIDSPLSVVQFQRAVNNQAAIGVESAIHQLASDLRSLAIRTIDPIPDQDSLKSRIRDTIRQHRTDLVTWDELQEIADTWDARTAPYLIDGMWRQRLLLSYQADGNRLLCSRSATDRLDSDSKMFVFHPALTEYCRLKPTQGAFTIGYV